MGLATGKDLHVDQHLTNLAINYRPQNFIADMIAPIVPVNKETDTYPVFSRFEHYALESTMRVRGQEANKITRSVGSANYQVKNYALASDITIEDMANMDQAYRSVLEAGKTRWLLGKLGLDMEKRVLTMAVNTSAVNTVFVVNSVWGGTTGLGANAGDPVPALFMAMEYMQSVTGQRPNSILWGWKAWNHFQRNYHVRNFLLGQNNGGGVVTRQMAQSLLELNRFLVTDAMWHTSNEANVNSYALTNPLQNQVILYYAPPAASLDDPSWMYSFRWNNPTLPAPLVVERHPYDSRRKIETIEAGYYQEERITGTDYAVRLITNAASGTAGLG